MHIRLVRKLANFLNGVDLTHRRVGDLFDCPEAEGRILVLEEWARVEGPAVSQTASVAAGELSNEIPSHSVLEIIDFHREGKKDKLRSSS